MKKYLMLVLIVASFSKAFSKSDKTYGMYIFVWNSTDTHSGAGHVSFAIENEEKNLDYFTYYMKGDGGGFHFKDVSLLDCYYLDKDSIGIQTAAPSLVIKLNITKSERRKAMRVAKMKIKNRWNLFTGNCADLTKSVIKKTKYESGLAFLISTPYEMIKDIKDHNQEFIENGEIITIVGDVDEYLEQQPYAIPYTISKFLVSTHDKKNEIKSEIKSEIFNSKRKLNSSISIGYH